MTDRQQELYRMICEQTKYNGFVYLDSLARVIYGDYRYMSEYPNRSAWRNQPSLKAMQVDVLEINKSDSQYKIVPVKHSNKLIGYKIADEEELDKRIEKYRREALRKWMKAKELEVAKKNNGQYRFTADDVIKEIKAYIGKC